MNRFYEAKIILLRDDLWNSPKTFEEMKRAERKLEGAKKG